MVVDGTVTLHVPISDVNSILHVNKVMANSGLYWKLTTSSNTLVIKGKGIDVDKILGELKSKLDGVKIIEIEELPKIHTTELKIEGLCKENADEFKKKVSGISGVQEVKLEEKDKKMIVKGTLESKKVVEEVSKVNILKVSLWPEK